MNKTLEQGLFDLDNLHWEADRHRLAARSFFLFQQKYISGRNELIFNLIEKNEFKIRQAHFNSNF